MKPVKFLLLIGILCCTTAIGAVVYEIGSMRGFLYGSEPACEYDNWLSHVSEGLANAGMNHYAPWDQQSNSFGSYRTPTSIQLDSWGMVLEAFCAGDIAMVDSMLTLYCFPYQQVIFDDLDSGREYHILRENLNDNEDDNGTEDTWDDQIGSFDYGWGLYVRDPGSYRNILVNCPHPKDDFPSVIMALEGFEKWNGRYLFIAGAGREASYPYGYMPNNNYSISDPSRVENHPFNKAYESAADEIRQNLGRMELSIQIHSYDWNTVHNEPCVQLSAGNGRKIPQLPIKDYSRNQMDLIHQAPFIVHPAGTIGDNQEVPINQYYSVHQHPDYPIYYRKDGYEQRISSNDSYPGYQYNKQMYYSTPPNDLDVESPFFHVEMDELPLCYEATEANYYWFYGWDAEAQSWNLQQRWTRFKAFYMRWIDDLAIVLNHMNPFTNHELPSNPSALVSGNDLVFRWGRSFSFDFDSYEIFIRYIDMDGIPRQQWFDREDRSSLAFQYISELEDWEYLVYSVKPLSVRIRARDKDGSCSIVSNEMLVSRPSDYEVNELSSQPYGNSIKVHWSSQATSSQTTIGWNVYRSLDGLEYGLYASYQTDPALQISYHAGNYYDTNVEPGRIYWYRMSRVFSNGMELLSRMNTQTSLTPVYSLCFSSPNFPQGRIWEFSHQACASDGYNTNYDQQADVLPEGQNFSFVSEPDYGPYLSRDVREFFDPSSTYKEIPLITYYPVFGNPVSISLNTGEYDLYSNLYLHDLHNNAWTDLSVDNYVINSYSGYGRYFRLYWGAYRPTLTIDMDSDLSVYNGYELHLSWSANPLVAVDSFSLYLSRAGMDYLIAENIPRDQNQIDWMVTGVDPGYNYRIKLVAHRQNSPDTELYSQHEIYVDESTYTAQYPQGWQTINIPVNSVYTTLYDLFGDYNMLYTLDPNGSWTQTEEVVANHAYLLYLDQAQEKQWPSTVPAGSYTYQMQQGWNLVPNPYPRSISSANLSFVSGNESHSYPEMIALEILAGGIFVLREKAIRPVWEIRPGEAFMMQVLEDSPVLITITTEATYDAPEPPTISWTGTLVFTDMSGSQTNVVLGSADLGTDDTDLGLDFPPPLDLPGTSLHSVILQGEEATELLSAYTGLYPQYSILEKTWALYLRKDTDSPCFVEFHSEDMPENYLVSINHWGQDWTLIPGEPLLLDLPSGESPLTLRVVSNYLAGHDAYQAEQALACYPNPFRQSLFIDCTSNQRGGSLEIFNLRGQLVKRETINEEGRQSIMWDGRDAFGFTCGSGLYLVRLRSGDTIQTRKVIKLD